MNTIKNAPLALVTGASRGIGKAIAEALAEAGYHLILTCSHTLPDLQEVAACLEEKYGITCTAMAADASEPAAIEKVFASLDHLDVLVNNAGIRRDGLLLWMPYEDWYGVLRTHLDGFFHVTQPLLKGMLVRKYGRIINIVSLSGIKGLPGQVNYSAAKGGLIAATRALAQEVAKKRVTVNAVAPGFIRTDMTADLDEAALRRTIPAGRFGEPEEVADLVAFLASEKASYITGEVISINGGIL